MQHSPSRPTVTALARITIAVCLTALLAPARGREAVQARPGEMVLLRQVAARPAYRQPSSPGMALLVDTSPRSQLVGALGIGSGEISDADYASLNAANAQVGSSSHDTAVSRALNGTLGNTALAAGSNRSSMASVNGFSTAVGGSLGSVSGATRGIGNQVTGALSQIPLYSGGH